MPSDNLISAFLCYRRVDSENITGRIFDRLESKFGKGHVFKDVNSIPFGADFMTFIGEEIARSQVLIAIIGKEWLDASDGEGNRRLDDPQDYVKLEIETALKQGIQVIPLLVNGAEMPEADELPKGIKKLAGRNAAWARADPDFHNDMDRLIQQISVHKKESGKRTARTRKSTTQQASSGKRTQTQTKRAQNKQHKISSKPTKKTVKLTQAEISKLPVDKPVVYWILTKAKNVNYIGTAKRGEIQNAIANHLPGKKDYVPGHKVQIIRMDRIRHAQMKAKELIAKYAPRYNRSQA